jgi:hypothetical protein
LSPVSSTRVVSTGMTMPAFWQAVSPDNSPMVLSSAG